MPYPYEDDPNAWLQRLPGYQYLYGEETPGGQTYDPGVGPGLVRAKPEDEGIGYYAAKLGGSLLSGAGSVIGAALYPLSLPKRGLDALARRVARAEGLNPSEDMTMGQMLGEAAFPGPPEGEGIGAHLQAAAKGALEFGADVGLDPVTYLPIGFAGGTKGARIATKILAEQPGLQLYAPKAAQALSSAVESPISQFAARMAERFAPAGADAAQLAAQAERYQKPLQALGTAAHYGVVGQMAAGGVSGIARAAAQAATQGWTPEATYEAVKGAGELGMAGLGQYSHLAGEQARARAVAGQQRFAPTRVLPIDSLPDAVQKEGEAWSRQWADQMLAGVDPDRSELPEHLQPHGDIILQQAREDLAGLKGGRDFVDRLRQEHQPGDEGVTVEPGPNDSKRVIQRDKDGQIVGGAQIDAGNNLQFVAGGRAMGSPVSAGPIYDKLQELGAQKLDMVDAEGKPTTLSSLGAIARRAVAEQSFPAPLLEGRESMTSLTRQQEEAKQQLSQAGLGDLLAQPAYAVEKTAPPFYSQLQNVVVDPRTQARQSGEQWLHYLSDPNRGVKADELKWTGLDDFLAERKGQPVTKQEIQQHLAENAVQVQEVTKGDDAGRLKRMLPPDSIPTSAAIDEGGYAVYDNHGKVLGVYAAGNPAEAVELAKQRGPTDAAFESDGALAGRRPPRGSLETKFSSYTTPGGENYRELLLTLPVTDRTPGDAAQRLFGKSYRELTPEQQTAVEQSNQVRFIGGHFDEPNVLAHIRFNDRVDSEGKRVLFVEEVQSDWAQKGRKEGFRTGTTLVPKQIEGGQWQLADKATGELIGTRKYEDYSQAMRAASDAEERVRGSAIPSAPFVTDTSKWTELAMKRVLKYAADNGYDKVTWTTGEQQAARYDLSKHVSEIKVIPLRMPGERIGQTSGWRLTAKGVHDEGNVITEDLRDLAKLDDFIGKEMGDKARQQIEKEGGAKLSGLDLKVGGEGMRAFYDQILPNVANKLGKKFGARVGETELPSTHKVMRAGPEDYRIVVDGKGLDDSRGRPISYKSEELAKAAISIGRRGPVVHSLDIPQAMRETVKREGFPLFAVGEKGQKKAPSADLQKLLVKLYPEGSHIKEEKGRFTITLPNKRQVVWRSDSDGIEIDASAFEKGYGRKPEPGEQAVGATWRLPNAAVVDIVQSADARAALHEHWHVLKHLGVLSDKQQETLSKRFKNEEEEADAFADWWKQEQRPANSIWQKIGKGISNLYELITGQPESVFRKAAKEALAGQQAGLPPTLLRRVGERLSGAPPAVKNEQDIHALADKLTGMAKAGEAGRYWYEDAAKRVKQLTQGNPEDEEKFLRLLAIYSPNNPVSGNWVDALQAWDVYKNLGKEAGLKRLNAGEKVIQAGRFGDLDRKAEDALFRDKEWKGLKTNSFYGNLAALLFPNREQSATIDVHMLRAYGYPRDTAGDAQYQWANALTKHVADQLGWTPWQTQAAIWATQRGEGKGAATFPEASRENVGAIGMEAVPHPDSGHPLAALASQPYDVRQRYTRDAMKAIVDPKTGVDELAQAHGLMRDDTIEGPGYYENEFNPGFHVLTQLVPEQGYRKGTPATSVSASRAGWENARNYARDLALLYNQKAAGIIRPFPSQQRSTNTGFLVELGKAPTREQLAAVVGAIPKDQRDGLFFDYSPEGLLVHNEAKTLDPKAFEATVAKAVNSIAGNATLSIRPFQSVSELVRPERAEGVWNAGEGGTAAEARSPAVQGAYDRVRARLDRVNERWGRGSEPGAEVQGTERVVPEADRGVDLEALPHTIEVDGRQKTFGAFRPAQEAALDYAKSAKIDYRPPQRYVKVDRERAARIAQAFEAMPHDPSDPAVKAAYDALARETMAQYQTMLDNGLKVEFIKGKDPYGNPRKAIEDVVKNNHLWVYPTETGFGQGEAYDATKHPMLQPTPFKVGDRPMLLNDVFRAVHDYFGHVKEGVGFRADGEENAWRSHSAMYSPLARQAMTTETRGQNSWLNFGPHGEKNRTAKPEDTVYAEQKAGLLPQWAVDEGATDAPNVGEPKYAVAPTPAPAPLGAPKPPGQKPRVEQRVQSLDEAVTEQRRLGIPAADLNLAREQRRTWASIDPEVQKKIKTWDDDEIFKKVERKRSLDDVEVQALDAVVRGRREAKELARLDYLDKKGGPDEAQAWRKYVETLANFVPLERANVNDGTGTARALAARGRIMQAAQTKDAKFLRQVLREIPGIDEHGAEELQAMFETGDPRLSDALRAAFASRWKQWQTILRAFLITPSSEMANGIGNSIGLGAEIADQAASSGVDWLVSSLRGTQRERHLGAVGAGLGAMIEEVPNAVNTFLNERFNQIYKRAWTGEGRPIEVGRRLEYQTGAPFIGTGVLARLGRLTATSLDAMQAGDELFQSPVAMQEMGSRAYELAKQKLGPGAPETRVRAETLNIVADATHFPEKYPKLINDIRSSTQRRLFKDKPWHMVQVLQNLSERYPWMSAVLPFIKTPGNIARYAIHHSPMGMLTPEFGEAVKRLASGKGEMSQGEASDVVARRLVGTAIFAMAAGAAKLGKITNGGPGDPNDKKALMETGWRPYSIVVNTPAGKAYIPFARFDPISQVMGIAADVAGLVDARDEHDAATRAIGSIAENFTSRTYLQGLIDFSEALSDPLRFAGNYAISIGEMHIPRQVARIAQALDPVVRDVKPTVGGVGGFLQQALNSIKRDIPGVSQTMPAKYGPTGEPVVRPGEGVMGFAMRAVSPIQVSPEKENRQLEAIMAQIGYSPSDARRYMTIKGHQIVLDQRQVDTMHKADAAAAYELRMLVANPMFAAMPDTIEEGGDRSKEAIIRKVYNKHRDYARQAIMQQPDFIASARQQLADWQRDHPQAGGVL